MLTYGSGKNNNNENVKYKDIFIKENWNLNKNIN